MTCDLTKSTALRNDRRSCNLRLLTMSVERGVAGEVRSAGRYGCKVDSIECSMDSQKWVSCSTTSRLREQAPAHGSSCDLGILERSLAYDIDKDMHKAIRKYDCPRLEEVRCHMISAFDVDCDIEIAQDAHIGRACRMEWVTHGISDEVSESLLDAEVKYGCKIPPFLNCVNSHRDGFTCAVAETAHRGGKRKQHMDRYSRAEEERQQEKADEAAEPREQSPPAAKDTQSGSKPASGKPPPPPPPPPPPASDSTGSRSPHDPMAAHGRIHSVFRHHHHRDREF